MNSNRGKLRKAIYLFQMGIPLPLVVRYFATTWLLRPMLKRDTKDLVNFKSKIAGKKFSTDWFLRNIPYWERAFAHSKFSSDQAILGLEIGSWEGMSSTFLLQRFPSLILTCVDTWMGGDEHDIVSHLGRSQIEDTFDANVREFGSRVAKAKCKSIEYFLENQKEKQFHLIYIDGSHHADDVLLDAILAFDRLDVDGIMIFDDLVWRGYEDLRCNPAVAIAAFLSLKKGCFEVLEIYEQLIIKKTQNLNRTIVN